MYIFHVYVYLYKSVFGPLYFGLLQEATEQFDQCVIHLIDTQFYLIIRYYDIRCSVVEKINITVRFNVDCFCLYAEYEKNGNMFLILNLNLPAF